MTKQIRTIFLACSLGFASTASSAEQAFQWGERNTAFEPAFSNQFRAQLVESEFSHETRIIATDLTHPWAIVPLPQWAGFLITERSGNLRLLKPIGELSAPIAGVPEVHYEKQGGLLDVAISPNFDQDRTVFLTYSKPLDSGMSATAAAKGVLSSDLTKLDNVRDIFVQTPPSPTPMHYGSRIVFDREDHVYITTGEHSSLEERTLAQDLDNTYGKIVRIGSDGSVPDDNPLLGQSEAVDSIWTLGHRNIQGAAFDTHDQLWVVEHGPQGGDELNAISPGKNYGWPIVSYGEQYSGDPISTGISAAEGLEQPTYFWDPVIGPGGMTFYHGEMYSSWQGDALISSYVDGGLVRLSFDSEGRVASEERLLRDIGGVRDLDVLDDGSIILISDKKSGEVIHVFLHNSNP